MPLYEYRCRTCDRRFELRRSMSESAAVASCPDGHDDTVRLLSTFAATGATTATATPSMAGAGAGAGGCCGGGCGCRH